MTPVFADYARHYDLLYQDKDYATEAGYVSRLISRERPSAKAILELGSGTGRHALCLTALGYRVYGVEKSARMLTRARARVASNRPMLRSQGRTPPSFRNGDMRAVRLGRRFDAVVSLFHAISYQATDRGLRAAFLTAHRHLDEGGLFLFDAWYGPAVLAARPAARVKCVGDERVELTRYAQPRLLAERNIVEVRYRLLARNKATGIQDETRETHRMRYVFKPEISTLARQCGFEILLAEEWLTHRPLTRRTWQACFLLKRTAPK